MGAAADPGGAPASYHGRPILRETVWEDLIGWYLFTGGLAGAALPLAAGARAVGNQRLARGALLAAAAGLVASPPLLIADLGRPERFHHMLRVLKPTSPMSVGTWLLSGAGLAAGMATAVELGSGWQRGPVSRLARWLRPAGRLAEVLGAALGPGLATYTGVLLGQTAVPVWHEEAELLPPLFAASAAASAGAAASLLTPEREGRRAGRLATVATALEVLVGLLRERRLGGLAEPLRSGSAGRLNLASRALGLGGAALLAPEAWSRRRRHGPLANTSARLGALSVLGGSACLRLALIHAGRRSAADPAHTVAPQRERLARRGGLSRPVAVEPAPSC